MIDGALYWCIIIFCTLLVLVFPLIIAHHVDKKYGDKINGELALALFAIITCEFIAGIMVAFLIIYMGE